MPLPDWPAFLTSGLPTLLIPAGIRHKASIRFGKGEEPLGLGCESTGLQGISFEEFKQFRKAESPKPEPRQSSENDDPERAAKRAAGNEFLFQHLGEVVIDHQNGIFAGTNDLVERIGGRPPMTLEAFIEKHRKAFV